MRKLRSLATRLKPDAVSVALGAMVTVSVLYAAMIA
jgi:hypothetical protein